MDPLHPDTVFIGGWGYVYRISGYGADMHSVNMPVTYPTQIVAVAVAPTTPSVVYAGGFNDDAISHGHAFGVAFRSVDNGVSWTQLDFGQPISRVADIVLNPTDWQVVYLATREHMGLDIGSPGLGVFRSTDGGNTWHTITQGMGHVPVLALAIHPDEPQTLYAGGHLQDESGGAVYTTTNGGDLWTLTGLQLDGGRVTSLAIDPLAPDTVYAGTKEGLFRTTDGGTTWTRATGSLGHARIESLSAASDSERTILYVGAFGGFTSETAADLTSIAELVDSDFVESGVYRQVIDHRPLPEKIYLPLILKE